VLCYEHHVEMKMAELSWNSVTSRQRHPCMDARSPVVQSTTASSRAGTSSLHRAPMRASERQSRASVVPRMERLMYLAKVEPAKKSFRLWRCPECAASHTNQRFRADSAKQRSHPANGWGRLWP